MPQGTLKDLKPSHNGNNVIPESAAGEYPESRVFHHAPHKHWVPASAGTTGFCSLPIYRRFWVMPNDSLRLPAQSLMNQAATFKLSAVSGQQKKKTKKDCHTRFRASDAPYI